MQRNIEINGLQERVRIYPFALSNENDGRALYIPLSENGEEIDSGGARLDPNDPTPPPQWKTVSVELRRLDDLKFGRPDLVKMDVEGHEYYAMLGMTETLSACPGLMIEWVKRNWQKSPQHYRRKETMSLLKSLGYNSFQRIGRADMWCEKE